MLILTTVILTKQKTSICHHVQHEGHQHRAHGVNVRQRVECDAPHHPGGVVAEIARSVTVCRLMQGDGEQNRQVVDEDGLNQIGEIHASIVALINAWRTEKLAVKRKN